MIGRFSSFMRQMKKRQTNPKQIKMQRNPAMRLGEGGEEFEPDKWKEE